MSKFKSGDQVHCVRPIDGLQLGRGYVVDRYDSLQDLVFVQGNAHGFVGYRFELISTPNLSTEYVQKTPLYFEPDGLPSGNEMPQQKNDCLESNIAAINLECQDAMFNWPEFNTAHEGYAVILEEVDELWDEVKKKPKNRDSAKMKAECIQIAAMALRFATEICDTKKANN